MQNGTPKKSQVTLERVTPETLPLYAPRLGSILSAQVLSGTSNNFILPFPSSETTSLFLRPLPNLSLGGPGKIIMWIAKLPPSDKPLQSFDMDGNETGYGEIVGSVQLALHVAPNGRFRSEVRKLLVDERYQRRGIGRTLMEELERVAKEEEGSTLCLLDTEEGGSGEKLYQSLGWKTAGIVPNYALVPDGKEKKGAVFMYKEL